MGLSCHESVIGLRSNVSFSHFSLGCVVHHVSIFVLERSS